MLITHQNILPVEHDIGEEGDQFSITSDSINEVSQVGENSPKLFQSRH